MQAKHQESQKVYHYSSFYIQPNHLLCHRAEGTVSQLLQILLAFGLTRSVHAKTQLVGLEFACTNTVDFLEYRHALLDAARQIDLLGGTVGLQRWLAHALMECQKLQRTVTGNVFDHDLVKRGRRHFEYGVERTRIRILIDSVANE